MLFMKIKCRSNVIFIISDRGLNKGFEYRVDRNNSSEYKEL